MCRREPPSWAESLEYQTAISEVLGAISRSPQDLQPVLEAIVDIGRKLCDAERAIIWRFEAGEALPAAFSGLDATRIAQIGHLRMPLGAGSIMGRAAQEGRAIQVLEPTSNAALSPAQIEWTRSGNIRTVLAVPLMREGNAIGGITVSRTVVSPFDSKQVTLLQTFADQAVIAIENTRLFEAEQASKRELQESLEYQTATSEVLNVISRSPTELQPVLDAIAATAARLCESMAATVWRVAGGRVRVVAQFGSLIMRTPSLALPLTRGSVTGRAIVDRKTIHVHDLAAMVETEYPDVKEVQQRVGHRTTLATPLLSQGEALGAISVRKNHVHPFSDRQIALLQTFADQAVIAIENARLFEEVQASDARADATHLSTRQPPAKFSTSSANRRTSCGPFSIRSLRLRRTSAKPTLP